MCILLFVRIPTDDAFPLEPSGPNPVHLTRRPPNLPPTPPIVYNIKIFIVVVLCSRIVGEGWGEGMRLNSKGSPEWDYRQTATGRTLLLISFRLSWGGAVPTEMFYFFLSSLCTTCGVSNFYRTKTILRRYGTAYVTFNRDFDNSFSVNDTEIGLIKRQKSRLQISEGFFVEQEQFTSTVIRRWEILKRVHECDSCRIFDAINRCLNIFFF